MEIFFHLYNFRNSVRFSAKYEKFITWEFAVQSLSQVQLFVTPWTAALQASLSFNITQSLLKLMSIEPVMPSNHLTLCHPLLLPPSIFPSIRVFSNESVLHIRWPKYGSFCWSITPSSEYSGLISFRMDWLDLLALQGTLKSLLQHHSLQASILHLRIYTFNDYFRKKRIESHISSLWNQRFVAI